MRLLILFVFGWTSLVAQSDETQVLTFKDFMDRVVIHHPIIRQANLQVATGDAAVLSARGAFDPKAKTGIYQKYFDSKQYYSLIDAGFTVPTWFGLEFKGGFEQNQGSFLNPENTLPVSGLWYAGVTVPIGKGLFIDERRTVLKQAEIYRDATEQERKVIVNDLLYSASQAYWQWYQSYYDLQILLDAIEAAEQQFINVKRASELGDKPALDTLESGIQLQNLQAAAGTANIQLYKAKMMLSNFLWENGSVPVQIGESLAPPESLSIEEMSLNLVRDREIQEMLLQHPELLLYNLKLDELDVEQRWKREQLKPQLDLSYNPISEAVGDYPFAGYSADNYTWGLSFSIPLLLRKERGSLQLTNIKIDNTILSQQQKSLELNTKANAFLIELQISDDQMVQYERIAADYFALWQAEIRLFDNGESSVFLINSRQQKYITARQKVNEIRAKNRIAEAGLNWSQALFPNWMDAEFGE